LAAGDAYAPRSLDAPAQTDEGDGLTGADLLADDGRHIARTVDATSLMQLADVLDDRSWEVVRLRFHEDLKQREIGDRVGCSQMHVSRILRNALAQMREAADAADFVFD
ncbi:MAG TPA: sigma-70 family RNA polymerase sigma factor, partial [Solirubrobacteraceae bacterium]|nr:sigma-70 family RNA polymerase sigma factor [Solirubrobacteraceae bacterium]